VGGQTKRPKVSRILPSFWGTSGGGRKKKRNMGTKIAVEVEKGGKKEVTKFAGGGIQKGVRNRTLPQKLKEKGEDGAKERVVNFRFRGVGGRTLFLAQRGKVGGAREGQRKSGGARPGRKRISTNSKGGTLLARGKTKIQRRKKKRGGAEQGATQRARRKRWGGKKKTTKNQIPEDSKGEHYPKRC